MFGGLAGADRLTRRLQHDDAQSGVVGIPDTIAVERGTQPLLGSLYQGGAGIGRDIYQEWAAEHGNPVAQAMFAVQPSRAVKVCQQRDAETRCFQQGGISSG